MNLVFNMVKTVKSASNVSHHSKKDEEALVKVKKVTPREIREW